MEALVFYVLLTVSLTTTSAEISIACSHGSSPNTTYCPGDTAMFLCNTTNKLLEWTILEHEVDFNYLDEVGTVEYVPRCNVSGLLVQHDPFFSSLLTLTVYKKYNNTPVRCLDILDRTTKECVIKILAPSDPPLTMDVDVLNSSSVRVSWSQPYIPSSQNIQYRVTGTPVDSSCVTCQAMKAITYDNSTVFINLQLLAEYQFSVTSMTCNGELESEPISRQVKVWNHNVTAVHGYCSIQFHIIVNIDWNFDGFKRQNVEIVIDLSNETIVKSIHKLIPIDINDTATDGLVNNTSLLSGVIAGLPPSTSYNWTVFFANNDERIVQIGSGFFNTSETCRLQSRAEFSASLVASGVVVFIFILLGVPIAVAAVVFWMCKKTEQNSGSEVNAAVTKKSTTPDEIIKKGISHEDIVIPIELPVTTNKDLPYLTKVTPL